MYFSIQDGLLGDVVDTQTLLSVNFSVILLLKEQNYISEKSNLVKFTLANNAVLQFVRDYPDLWVLLKIQF